ncbi:5-carboxymethyl-2-hydroxymuconate Delta-isomerase [Pseudomonas gingeri]|uniref:5-carboxymethyl-2-hydroxymuconate Delta-isomerase n=1 Tax=Pseudomonas TaxID=286 RepID=UPI0015A164B9|nr:5-carboxymethyl-2-hydroxymuconate Delta-isomerase [Pseudomonas gingeri]NVZ30277.1 5-carboxymethyl-2-hydroxymuconate Delta-isomerase [Pseudomonas gingeri]NWE46994.1 5-carboxymethyl-2-hydroxymuconate Delta-isomerase [Pseudomonas gingeri]NWE69324.1 5-carboxymethyl-2-hydroxymuconate Delta-isomerase [Pseudomonas gingeri]
MPHVFLEYTPNLSDFDADKALLRINHALVASGQFAAESDIKSRATRLTTFRVGTGLGERGFVHVKLELFGGRSVEVKKQLSESILSSLKDLDGWPSTVEVHLSVDVVDMVRETYLQTIL